MPELLTESFCERCGTRYTFEAARQRVRLKGVKTLSRGLKNFVMSDDTSMDEAMAAARNETDREVTGHQLDAFHQTFNFCMSCRQYTCPNCWNEAEARCLSCAPHLGHEILPAPFPDMEPMIGLNEIGVAIEPETLVAGGTNGLNGSNGHVAAAELAEYEAAQEAADGLDEDDEFDAIARLDSLTAPAAVVAEPDVDEAVEVEAVGAAPEPFAAEVDVEPVVGEAQVEAEPFVAEAVVVEAEVEPVAAAKAEAEVEPIVAEAALGAEPVVAEAEVEAEPVIAEAPVDVESLVAAEAVAEVIEPTAAVEPEPEPVVAEAEPAADHNAAAAAAIAAAAVFASRDEPRDIHEKISSQTGGLLRRFRPGQNLDAELAAYEVEQAAAVTVAADAAITEAPVTAEADPPPAAVEATPVEIETQAPAVPAPSIVEAAATEPVPTEAPAPEPVVAEPEDIFVQPTWQRVAPDPTPEAPVVPSAPPAPSVPLASAAAQPDPSWPADPQWPSTAPSTAGLPFLNRPAAPQGGVDALWAISNQEVAAQRPTAGKTSGGVQPCVSCGLSLSANARFCRRCGSLQGG